MGRGLGRRGVLRVATLHELAHYGGRLPRGLLAPMAGGSVGYYDATILSESGLVAYWKLDETSGTTAADSKGSNSGTYTGGFTLNQAGVGDGNSAVGLNGSTGYVSVPSAAGLHPAHVSAEVWVNPTVTNHGAGFLCSNSYTTAVGYELGDQIDFSSGLTDQVTLFGSFNTSWTVEKAGSSLSTGAWHHVVGTYDGSTLALYIDGVLIASSAASLTLAYDNNELRIGRRHDSGASPFFNGLIAKAAVYNVALSAQQIANHYSAAKLAFQTKPPWPQAMWRSAYR